MNANLGTKIAAKRKDIGLSQIEFADRLSVTRQTVSRWENGTVMPDIDKISDIAEILGVSCDYLLRDDIEKDEYDKERPFRQWAGSLKGSSERRLSFISVRMRLMWTSMTWRSRLRASRGTG